MRYRFFLLALPLLAAAFPASASPQEPRPTVVFESGLGDGAGVWRKIIFKLGKNTPTFSYARPGYDWTWGTDAPRDPCTIATELHARLAAAGRKPPYLLVGHSLGGQYAYAFSRLYPSETAGLILVDATPPGHWQAMQDNLPIVAGFVKTVRLLKFSRTMRHEFDAQDQCLDRLPQTPLPFPTRVLLKTKPDAGGGEELLDIQRQLAQKWLKMTGAAKVEPVEGAGHYIQSDKPDVLLAIIRELDTGDTKIKNR